jgi:hypothetical protein
MLCAATRATAAAAKCIGANGTTTRRIATTRAITAASGSDRERAEFMAPAAIRLADAMVAAPAVRAAATVDIAAFRRRRLRAAK